MVLEWNNNLDNKMSLYICAYIFFNALNAGLKRGLGFSGTLLTVARLLIYIVLAYLILRFIHGMTKNRLFQFLGLEILAVFVLFFSYLQGASLSSLQSTGLTLTTVCIPCGLCAYWIEDKDVLYQYLVSFSWPIFFVNLLNLSGDLTSQYDMHFSYIMLLVLLVHLNEWFRTRKVIYMFFAILELMLIVIFGSRGALVCFAAFIAFKLLFLNINLSSKLVLITTMGVVATIFFTYSNKLILLLYNTLTSKGYWARTLRLLVNGELLSHDSGRNEIWSEAVRLIEEKPILGWGITGAAENLGVSYAHQLFLDLMLSFGVPIGLFLSALLIRLCLKWMHFLPGCRKDLAMIFVSIAFVSMMFSSTIFTNYFAAIMIGLLLSKQYAIQD